MPTQVLFNNSDFDKLSEFESPLMKIPKWLVPEYTYGERVKIKHNYMDDSKGKPHNLDWTKNIKIIEEMMNNDKFEGELWSCFMFSSLRTKLFFPCHKNDFQPTLIPKVSM